MGEVWTQWQGRIVNGIYPLRRFLNASDHSSVFLTESSTEGFLNAAIKLVPGEAVPADVQLWHWKTAATFSHPHLMRLLDSGQCELEGRQLLFVVMEYAEETLSQVLPYRALGEDEVRELLVSTLDALAYLHRENWIQGQLKPSNFLVVNDQLKLATDTIRPVSVAREQVTHPTIYDPPEAERGEISVAADIWGLGVTLVEALTQYPPSWHRGRSEPPTLPLNLPESFAGIVQRCFSVNPADRPTVAELQRQTAPVPQQTAPAAPVGVNVGRPPAGAAPPLDKAVRPQNEVIRAEDSLSRPSGYSYQQAWDPGSRSPAVPVFIAIVIVLLAAWGGYRFFRGHSTTAPQAVADTQTAPILSTPSSQEASPSQDAPPRAPEAAAPAPAPPHPSPPRPQPAQAPAPAATNTAGLIVHEEIPKVSESSRHTIHGHVRVAVRVTVDPSGKVVRDTLENASSSNYFNRVASEAARKWRFASADGAGTREWLLHFEFGRDGTTVHATRSRS